MRYITSCGLALAFLFGTVFAQQPAPSDASERERILLERIERLERRVNELESRCAATARERSAVDTMESPRQLAGPTPPNVAAQNTTAPQAQLPNAASQNAAAQQQTPTRPTPGAASQQSSQTARANPAARPPAPPPLAAWDKDGVKIIPYGILIANVNYNSLSVDPGSIVGFALPAIPTNTPQFNISPGNTFLGVDIKWPKIGDWERSEERR